MPPLYTHTHTHTAAVDFSSIGFPLFGFLDLFTTGSITIPTIEDIMVEEPEELVLRLTLNTSPGSSLGYFEVIRDQATVIIRDDDDGGEEFMA